MGLIVKKCFPNAVQVIDRFHVQQLAAEALQEIWIKHRWKAIDDEIQAIEKGCKLQKPYSAEILSNGGALKQLLERSRYLLYKSQNQWAQDQKDRGGILFGLYPDLEKAYELSQRLSRIYNSIKDKGGAYARLGLWHQHVEVSGFISFNRVSRTINNHYRTILNHFDNRSLGPPVVEVMQNF